MRSGKGSVRSPKGSRLVKGSSNTRNISVGTALRAAKRDLFLKRFFLLVGGLVALSALAVFILNGTAENLFHTVLDYLM